MNRRPRIKWTTDVTLFGESSRRFLFRHRHFAKLDERLDGLIDRLKAGVARVIPQPMTAFLNRVRGTAHNMASRVFSELTEIEQPFGKRPEYKARFMTEPTIHGFGISSHRDRLTRY